MADSQVALYLIAYDIANPKRLSRVHSILKKQGLPLQYSVFTVVIKRKKLIKLLSSINEQINPTKDDIRCYRLPEHSDVNTLGRQFFPKDVMLFSNGVNQIFSS